MRLGPVELAAHHLGRRLGGVAEPLPPDAPVPGTQAVLEEQLEVAVVPPEHPVVERLPVVRVRAAVEEEPGQRLPLRMPRLAPRTLLALAEAAGQRGERRGQPLPQVPRGRVGTRVEEQPGGGDGVTLGNPGVDEVHQRHPAERAAVTGGGCMPVFMRAGCNTGSCHGAARGKDGFRLSLFGFDPEGDHYRLTREMSGRRINLAVPADSTVLEKADRRRPAHRRQAVRAGERAVPDAPPLDRGRRAQRRRRQAAQGRRRRPLPQAGACSTARGRPSR